MDNRKEEILKNIRAFWLGEDFEIPDSALINELYANDPEFRKAYDEDAILSKAKLSYAKGHKERSLELFNKIREFCHGKKVELPSYRFITLFYQSNSIFREACDNDPLVRAVIIYWLEESENV